MLPFSKMIHTWRGRDQIVDGFLGGVVDTLFEAGSHVFEVQY
jgi:hypothetical protein